VQPLTLILHFSFLIHHSQRWGERIPVPTRRDRALTFPHRDGRDACEILSLSPQWGEGLRVRGENKFELPITPAHYGSSSSPNLVGLALECSHNIGNKRSHRMGNTFEITRRHDTRVRQAEGLKHRAFEEIL